MPAQKRTPLVLVTGATGFIAGHCIRELLEHSYGVRGTVRDPAKADRSAHLRVIADSSVGTLELAEADLSRDDGWDEAVADCTYVLHVASPNPSAVPRDEEELIQPAVQGTCRVLTASARSPTVRRVVLTSSIAAILGANRQHRVHTEADWPEPEAISAYAKSKTLAERAAWEFVAELPEGQQIELAVINPGLTLGPMLSADSSTSMEVIARLLKREIPATARIGFAVADVRDVAAAHRLAMERPQAAGRRYICAGEHVWMQDMAKFLAAELGPEGYRIPTGLLPNWVVRVLSVFDPTVRLALDYLGVQERVSCARAINELGWSRRPAEESIIAAARSMIEHGLVPPPAKHWLSSRSRAV